mmetsp:Transcript_5382/g.14443  ORF Transcript_5382/g.14443 Transcript_5382/m.14443 type:complete len:343 (-) Transcript_5382:869-1897(-)
MRHVADKALDAATMLRGEHLVAEAQQRETVRDVGGELIRADDLPQRRVAVVFQCVFARKRNAVPPARAQHLLHQALRRRARQARLISIPHFDAREVEHRACLGQSLSNALVELSAGRIISCAELRRPRIAHLCKPVNSRDLHRKHRQLLLRQLLLRLRLLLRASVHSAARLAAFEAALRRGKHAAEVVEQRGRVPIAEESSVRFVVGFRGEELTGHVVVVRQAWWRLGKSGGGTGVVRKSGCRGGAQRGTHVRVVALESSHTREAPARRAVRRVAQLAARPAAHLQLAHRAVRHKLAQCVAERRDEVLVRHERRAHRLRSGGGGGRGRGRRGAGKERQLICG